MIQNLDHGATTVSAVLRRSSVLTARWQIWPLFALCWAGLVALYVGLAWSLNRYHALWSPDVGARFGMVRNWLKHGRLIYMDYGNAVVDPTGQIFPLAGYSVHLPKGICVIYPPLFPFLSGLEYRAFGFDGLTLLPLLGGLGTLLVAHATAKRLALGHRLLFPLVLGLATPVLIYSVVFWDHSLQMFLTALAGYGVLRSLEGTRAGEEAPTGRPPGRAAYALAAGAALGTGVWLHEAFLILFVGVALAGLSLRRFGSMRRSTGLLALGFAPVVLAWAAFNGAVYGFPTGAHFMGPNDPLHPYHIHAVLDPAELGGRVVRQLLGTEGAVTGVAVLGVSLVAYVLLARLKAFARLRPQALSLLHLAVAGASFFAIAGGTWVHGLFTATPLLAPALATSCSAGSASDGQAPSAEASAGLFYAWLGRACAVFTLGVLLSGNDPGMEWGSRYLLTMLPFLVLLADRALTEQYAVSGRSWRPVAVVGAAALVAVSAFSECRAVTAVRGDLVYSRALIDTAWAAPSPILVTDRWWLPVELTAGRLPQTQYLVRTPEDRAILVATLRRRKGLDLTFMGSPEGLASMTQALTHGSLTHGGAPFRLVASWSGGGLQLARFVRPSAPPPRPVTKRVLALYYPWYGTPGVSGRWMHQEGVDPAKKTMSDHTHYPVGGPYDSADPAVIERHLQEAKAAGIDTLVCSWWGPKDPTDKAIRLLLRRASAHGMKVCVLWEQLSAPGGPLAAASDLSYLLSTIGQHPDYLKQNGRPVVFVYAGTAQGLSADQWITVTDQTDRAHAPGAFLVGVARSSADALLWDGFFDLNTARPLAGLAPADAARVEADTFRVPIALARRVGAVAVEAVQPGADDRRRGRPGGTSVDRRDGQLYRALWEQAIKDKPDWVLVNSFNQWHAGTEIEPSVEMGDKYLALTAELAARFKNAPSGAKPSASVP